jgi:hypothetical protein
MTLVDLIFDLSNLRISAVHKISIEVLLILFLYFQHKPQKTLNTYELSYQNFPDEKSFKKLVNTLIFTENQFQNVFYVRKFILFVGEIEKAEEFYFIVTQIFPQQLD